MTDLLNPAQSRMEKSLEALERALAKLRTGRAHPGLLEQIIVPYYGTDAPISQAANITVVDARTLSVTPWDKSMVAAIEKAIMNSGLGLNPCSAGEVIRVPLPPLTEERRRDITKLVRGEAENARVSVRNVRRDTNQQVKDQLKDKELAEDEAHKLESRVQKLTDDFIGRVDCMVSDKENEIMEI